MGISLKTHKVLWGRSASLCAIETCRKELSVDTFDLENYFTIGDEAHIISEKENGPRSRFKYNFPIERIDDYENLILLCKNHHKEIDSDENYFTKEFVTKIKSKHEKWVQESLKQDSGNLKDDELLAEYVDEIEKMADFNNWQNWTFTLMPGFPKIKKQNFDNLVKLNLYLQGRIYPKKRSSLLKAINQFNEVLECFLRTFEMYKDDSDSEYYEIEQLYRRGVMSAEKQCLHELWLEQLVIELTKASNFLCTEVRNSIFPAYRLKEGLLLMRDVDQFSHLRLEYKNGERFKGMSSIISKSNKLYYGK
jgi:hypothetical protein